MPNYSFNHIHLTSPNPQKTSEFYEKMLGATQISITDIGFGRSIINLNLNGITILISPTPKDSSQSGLDHFGIRTDDLVAAINELKSKGVVFTKEATKVRPGLKISFLSAPEKVRIELQEGEL